MRNIAYLSPTSIAQWRSDQEEFYLKYLAFDRPSKIPQTDAMSVGSSFDAHVKSYLSEMLFGKNNFETLFESQVEPQNRAFALRAGAICFEAYKCSGALADLMLELQQSKEPPQFEFTVGGDRVEGLIGGVVFLGKPDARYVDKRGRSVILDWKVNGYCSKWGGSPVQGYVRIRDGWTGEHSRSHCTQHKNAIILEGINENGTLDIWSEDWARQLSIYSWLVGEEVGGGFVVAVDQLACKDGKIRVAEHRCRISKEYQQELLKEAQEIWEIVHSDWIFRELDHTESLNRQAVLDAQAEGLRGEGTENDEWFNTMSRG